MELKIKNLDKLIVVGDKILVKKLNQNERTKAGLLLPPGVHEKEEVQSGYIMKVGPGYPIPMPGDESEPWKQQDEQIKYIPLQAKIGDLAIFLQKQAFEIEFDRQKYFIVPNYAILLLYRDNED
jgi:co-chaperonin GroES (HSP10)